MPILLVGTKTDLADERAEVTEEDVQDLQNKHHGDEFVGYIECSALMDIGITEVFESAVQMYRKWRNTKSGRKVRTPTIRQLNMEREQRRISYAQQMNAQADKGRTKCVACLAKFCPAMAAYMESDEGLGGGVELNIASVPKDKFGDELAEPSYSKQHFFVNREFSFQRFIYAIIAGMCCVGHYTLYSLFCCGVHSLLFSGCHIVSNLHFSLLLQVNRLLF